MDEIRGSGHVDCLTSDRSAHYRTFAQPAPDRPATFVLIQEESWIDVVAMPARGVLLTLTQSEPSPSMKPARNQLAASVLPSLSC